MPRKKTKTIVCIVIIITICTYLTACSSEEDIADDRLAALHSIESYWRSEEWGEGLFDDELRALDDELRKKGFSDEDITLFKVDYDYNSAKLMETYIEDILQSQPLFPPEMQEEVSDTIVSMRAYIFAIQAYSSNIYILFGYRDGDLELVWDNNTKAGVYDSRNEHFHDNMKPLMKRLRQ